MIEAKAENVKSIEVNVKGIYATEESFRNSQADYSENNPEKPNYIKNRTHYEMTTTGPLEITWDGDMTGRASVLYGEGLWGVKVSDFIPTLEEIQAGEITLHMPSEDMTFRIRELEMNEWTSGGGLGRLYSAEDLPLMASVGDGYEINSVPVVKGLYVLFTGDYPADYACVSRLYFPSVTTKNIRKLDSKFLDLDWIPIIKGYTDTVLLPEGEYTQLADHEFETPIDITKITTITVTINETAYKVSPICDVGLAMFGNFSFVEDTLPNSGEPFFGLLSSGTLELYIALVETVTASVVAHSPIFDKVPDYYLPDFGPLEVDYNDGAGIEDNIFAIGSAWNSGRPVILTNIPTTVTGMNTVVDMRLIHLSQYDVFGDVYLASFIDGNGNIYRTRAGAGELRIALKLGETDYWEFTDAVLWGVEDENGYGGFLPKTLNSTLTANSKLPAQEGAVHSAISDLQTRFDAFQSRVTAATETIENTLNGGAS